MQELPTNLINDFSKMIANAQNKEVKRDNLYGTICIENGQKRVRIDGSTINTPFVEATEVNEGDRVLVLLREHSVQVIGKVSNE